jgi:hypothetical protein
MQGIDIKVPDALAKALSSAVYWQGFKDGLWAASLGLFAIVILYLILSRYRPRGMD